MKMNIDPLLEKIGSKLFSTYKNFKVDDKEYDDIVKDIMEHEEFLKLENYLHHNSSILEHVKKVSYLSYRVAKILKLDYISAARGGLLHDFFLYDWRTHDFPDLHKDKYHGIRHPDIALENSKKYFKLNEIETDIILKHMWPITIVLPKYKESYIVMFADKYISTKEVKAIIQDKVFKK